jgi:hypothetical protein
MDRLSRHVLLNYLQSWGQPILERIDALNQAVHAAGIRAKFVQNGNVAGWDSESESETERAREFRKRLDRVWCGSFEGECRSIEMLIAEFAAYQPSLFDGFIIGLEGCLDGVTRNLQHKFD